MVFVPCPNVVQVECIYGLASEFSENVYHYQFAAPPTALDLNNLIDAIKVCETNHLASTRGNDVTLQRIKATDLSVQNGLQVDRQIIPPVSGTNAGICAPANVSLAVAFRTGLAGRSFRGRIFHIGLPITIISSSRISSANAAVYAAAYTFMLNPNPAGSQPLVVLSRRHNNAPRAVGVATPVTSVTVNTAVDSQRRRLPEHNRHG